MTIPQLSQRFFTPRMLGGAFPTAQTYKALFDEYDARPGNQDKSHCDWIANFCGGAVGWISKLSIDADGRAAEEGYKDGEQLDPDSGQNDTSLHFADHTAIDSEGFPGYVLPGGSFGMATELQLGDVGVLIYRDRIAAVALYDSGPTRKIGEASIRAHERLQPAAPDPCSRRDDQGRCTLIRNASIDSSVIAIFIKGSAIRDLAESTAQQQIQQRAFSLFTAIGGIVPAGSFIA